MNANQAKGVLRDSRFVNLMQELADAQGGIDKSLAISLNRMIMIVYLLETMEESQIKNSQKLVDSYLLRTDNQAIKPLARKVKKLIADYLLRRDVDIMRVEPKPSDKAQKQFVKIKEVQKEMRKIFTVVPRYVVKIVNGKKVLIDTEAGVASVRKEPVDTPFIQTEEHKKNVAGITLTAALVAFAIALGVFLWLNQGLGFLYASNGGTANAISDDKELVLVAPVWREVFNDKIVVTTPNIGREFIACVYGSNFELGDRIICSSSKPYEAYLDYINGKPEWESYVNTKEIVACASPSSNPKDLKIRVQDSTTIQIVVQRADVNRYEERNVSRKKTWEQFVSYDKNGAADSSFQLKDQVDMLVGKIDFRKGDKIVVNCNAEYQYDEFVVTGVHNLVKWVGEKTLYVKYEEDRGFLNFRVLALDKYNITTKVMRYQ